MTLSAMKSGWASLKMAAPMAWPTATQRIFLPWASATAFQLRCRAKKNGIEKITSPSWRGKRIQTSGCSKAGSSSRKRSCPGFT